MMTDASPKMQDLANITSSLKIDEAILRSRKVMEESKALTFKNSQKKSALEEKLKSMLSAQEELSPEHRRHQETPKIFNEYTETPKPSSSNLQVEELSAEIRMLNNKISTQNTTIRMLELNLGETKTENQRLVDEIQQLKLRHKQEIQYLTEMYEDKLKNPQFAPKELMNIESRLNELEDKFTKQVDCNVELLGKINDLNRTQELNTRKTKLLDAEIELENNRERYQDLHDKLQKAKNMIKSDCDRKSAEPKKPKKPKKTEEETGKKIKKVNEDTIKKKKKKSE